MKTIPTNHPADPIPRWRSRALLALATALAVSANTALAHGPYGHDEPDWHDSDHGDRRHAPHEHRQGPGYWSPVLNAALTFGGERLATVEVDTAFSGTESEDIRAGELFMFGGGLLFTDGNLQVQGTVNYHVDGVFGENGDASFTRWPLELLVFTTTPRWRIGGGITHHLDPEVEIDIDFQPRQKATLKNATGIVFQADYRLSEQLSIGLRHTQIDYEPDNNSDVEIDGDNTGLSFTLSF